ncbi:glycoside hydrolase family 15 protein [Dactylosporangium cerinum]|uniref:Glycoside hydrolase family 15 protein n=1 Tax=Dactylosporangium cerinum TaxID=1434730 RepID=A0ABV9W0X4_9ACTN
MSGERTKPAAQDFWVLSTGSRRSAGTYRSQVWQVTERHCPLRYRRTSTAGGFTPPRRRRVSDRARRFAEGSALEQRTTALHVATADQLCNDNREPARPHVPCHNRQLYLPGTAILITRFMSPEGVGELLDFMPITGNKATDQHRILRILRIVRGHGRFVFECEPRFDYGRVDHETALLEDGQAFRSASEGLNLNPMSRNGSYTKQRTERGFRLVHEASAGDSGGVVLETSPGGPPHIVPIEEMWHMYELTRNFWCSWIGRSKYQGRWQEMVERSAIALKLMTYAPTGALIAAPTAGLPEHVGGERNWDYRYTWIRDASLSVQALLGLDYTEEAEAFLVWLTDRLADAGRKHEPVHVLYRVDGGADLPEHSLPHLDGYQDSRPVRIGNHAAEQLQLDIYGEVLDAVYRAGKCGLQPWWDAWHYLAADVDWLCDNWDRPDDGIWETRGGRQDHTYSRVMSWVAFDRAMRLSRSFGLPGDMPRWMAQRNKVYQQMMERGWDPEQKAFVQRYNSPVLDAAMLYMPLVGFVSPRDPRWRSTLDAIDRHLVSDSLVYRYDPEASPDGLPGAEGTFSMCTFWYVEALASSGRLSEARLTFEKMLTYSNPLGLYSEEIGPTGEQLGNFPQAFSHLALINAAMRLDQLIRARR